MAQIKFFRGTKENYNSNLAKNADEVKNSIYFITDEHCIMMSGKQYGGVDNEMFKGFIKDVDVEGNVLSFKKDVEGTWTDVSIKLLEAADKSIVLGTITNGGVTDGSTIKVNVKAVGDADGLKLGNDGLYVDLTNTTKKIDDEINRAKKAEEANSTAISQNTAAITTLNGAATVEGSVAKSVKDAIEALDVAQVGGTGKVITTVSETNGKISSTAIDLKAENVAFTPTSKVTGAVDVTGSNVKDAIASLAKSVKSTQNSAATYKVVKVTEGLATNVKEAYQLVQTVNGADTNIPVQIPIYKDQTLKSVELVAEDDKKKKGQFMKYTYINADGADTIVYVDCSKLLAEAEFKNGLAVSAAGEVSVKIDTTSETFLTVGKGGVKLAGVQTAIDTAKNAVQNDLNAEITRAKAAEEANKTAIGVNAAAIAKLNGDEVTIGSVAKAVADAKAELLGDAATEYNTLGKLEDKIQALDVKATKAHTEVVAKTDGHVRVAVADSTDKTHKVVTISENDIASATALTTEVNRAKAAEDKIEASVGLAADGSHVQSTGHYTNSATTVVGEIAALDTQVYTNVQSIAAVTGIANQNKQDIATINGKLAVASAVTVKGSTNITVTPSTEGSDNHKVFTVAAKDLATTAQHDALATRVTNTETKINTLNGSATTQGSVAYQISAALSWIEGGTY